MAGDSLSEDAYHEAEAALARRGGRARLRLGADHLIGGLAATLLPMVMLCAAHHDLAEEKVASASSMSSSRRRSPASFWDIGEGSRCAARSPVCARNLDLKDPDGVPAMQAEVDLRVGRPALPAAQDGACHAQSVSLEIAAAVSHHRDRCEEGARTTSLQRAIAPRGKKLPKPDEPKSATPLAWSIGVDALTIHDGSFEQRDAPRRAQPRSWRCSRRSSSATPRPAMR